MVKSKKLLEAFKIHLGHTEYPVQHSHEFHEFFICLDGDGTQHCGRNTIKMKLDDFFFFPAGQMHIGNGGAASGCLGGVLYLSDNFFDEYEFPHSSAFRTLNALKQEALAGRNLIELDEGGIKSVRTAFLDVLAELNSKMPAYRLAAEAEAVKFIVRIMRHAQIPLTKTDDDSDCIEDVRIRDVCVYIRNNLSEVFTVENLALMTGLSRSRFHDLFKNSTGMPLMEFINRSRIEHSMKILSVQAVSIKEAALSSGFRSMPYFFAAFKRYTGSSPEKFRRKSMR